MFDNIIVKKNGSEVKKLASRKQGLLQVTIDNLQQANLDVSKNTFLSQEQKDDIYSINNNSIEEIKNAYELLQVMIDNLPDADTFELSLKELNFLNNKYVVRYE